MPHAPHPAQQQTTEVLTKVDQVRVSIGAHRWTVPTTTILASVGGALLAAWGYVRSEWADLRAADDVAAQKIAECQSQLATSQVLLAEIRTQLARIDARVAEVQVTLMRAGRP